MNCIRTIREAARPPLSQIALARRAGVSVYKLSVWESGGARPGPVNKAKLARALGVAVAKLFPEVRAE
jgi:transcriptional regulator with XRE-family HTH domain